MREGAAFRGQPLLMLAALLVGWLGLRVALWEPPLEVPAALRPTQASLNPFALSSAPRVELPAASIPSSVRDSVMPAPTAWSQLAPAVPPLLEPVTGSGGIREAITVPRDLFEPPLPQPSRAVIGHNLLLIAGLAQMQLPPALAVYDRLGFRAVVTFRSAPHPAKDLPARPTAQPQRGPTPSRMTTAVAPSR